MAQHAAFLERVQAADQARGQLIRGGAVQQEQIDMFSVEAGEGVLDRHFDAASGEVAATVRADARLGADKEFIAAKGAYGAAEALFAFATTIGGAGVEEARSGVQGRLDHVLRCTTRNGETGMGAGDAKSKPGETRVFDHFDALGVLVSNASACSSLPIFEPSAA